jgi:hypothetical protein
LEKEDNKRKEAQKREQKEQRYKEVLKERVECELGKTPKVPFSPQPITSNMVKVNLEKIYNDEPLLM